MKNTTITWPTVVIVVIICAFICALYKMSVISGPAVATSVLGTILGSLLKPMLTDKSGGASIVPPAFGDPPISLPAPPKAPEVKE